MLYTGEISRSCSLLSARNERSILSKRRQVLLNLRHPVAEAGFKSDKDALDWADAGVLVLPCGRSAHLKLGYLSGQGKPCVVLSLDPAEPELMVKLCIGSVVGDLSELLTWAKGL